jgi:hypothetical protein
MSGRHGGRRRLFAVAVTLTVISSMLMVVLYDPHGDPSRVYYGTDTRMQALLIGVLLAIGLTRPQPQPVGRGSGRRRDAWIAREALGWIGLAVLSGMIVGLDGTDAVLYRGGFTVAALAAAALVNASVTTGLSPLATVLSVAPLRFIGRISYGLYLYHWPVYVWLTPQRTDVHGDALLALRLAVTFAIATVSYYVVEQPIRNGGLRALRFPRPARWALAPAMAAVVLVVVLTTTTGAQSWETYLSGGKRDTTRVHAVRVPPGQPKGLILGDSVAFTVGAQGPPIPTETAWQVSALTACGLVPGTPVSGDRTFDEAPPECATWPQFWTKAIDELDPDIVLVIAGAWEVIDHLVDGRVVRADSPEGEQVVRQQLELGARIATSKGARVVFVDTPCYGPAPDAFGTPERTDPTRIARVNRIIDEVIAATPRAQLLRWSEFLCPNGQYLEQINGAVIRYDGLHFFGDGKRLLWEWMGPRLDRMAERARRVRTEETVTVARAQP